MTKSNKIRSIFAGIAFCETSLALVFRDFRIAALLGRVFFGPETFDGRSCTNEPAAHKALDFVDLFAEPAVVLMGVKVGFGKLRANGEPSIPNIVGVAKELDFLTTQTKPLNHVVNLFRLLQGPEFGLFCHYYVNINIGMNKVMT